jgi:TDG/mug DNA glycosylase family protein
VVFPQGIKALGAPIRREAPAASSTPAPFICTDQDFPNPASIPSSVLVPDLLRPGLGLVFCGTAPSRASFAARAYYAKPGNRFWPTLAKVGLTPELLPAQEYARLLTWNIGLTDLCKHHCGTDAELPKGSLDALALKEKLAHFQPERLAFTSKNAAQAALGIPVSYGRQASPWQNCQIWVLPSPSGLATRFWDIQPWQALAEDFQKC